MLGVPFPEDMYRVLCEVPGVVTFRVVDLRKSAGASQTPLPPVPGGTEPINWLSVAFKEAGVEAAIPFDFARVTVLRSSLSNSQAWIRCGNHVVEWEPEILEINRQRVQMEVTVYRLQPDDIPGFTDRKFVFGAYIRYEIQNEKRAIEIQLLDEEGEYIGDPEEVC